MTQAEFFNKFGVVLESREEITDSYELTTDNWDSVALLGSIALIDECFGVTVPGQDLANCRTAGAVWDLVRQNIAG